MKILKKFGTIGLAGFLFAASLHAAALDEDDMDRDEDAPKLSDTDAEPVKKELPSPKKQPPAWGGETKRAKPAQRGGIHIDMVELPSGIYMGKYEVTQGQWQAIMGSNPAVFTNCGDNCPVEVVTWEDVRKFIKKLNSQTGKNYRLPTEDEWYDACQGGKKGFAYCGSDNIDAVAWYKGNSAESVHPVGQKQPNAYGLYDMSGNVSEWTSSCNQGKCSRRVYIGGSWIDTPAQARANSIPRYDITYTGYLYLGFRLALDRTLDR